LIAGLPCAQLFRQSSDSVDLDHAAFGPLERFPAPGLSLSHQPWLLAVLDGFNLPMEKAAVTFRRAALGNDGSSVLPETG
jgi:hypothetical protein